MKIDEKEYIQNLLASEVMISYYSTILPIKTSSPPTFNQVDDHTPIDMVAYQWLVRKLMYLAFGTKPDITFVKGQLSCHNSDPWIDHIHIAKQTFWDVLCQRWKIKIKIKIGMRHRVSEYVTRTQSFTSRFYLLSSIFLLYLSFLFH